MGLWSLSRHRACIVPTVCCGCPTGWDGRERDECKHRTGPTSCIYIHVIHLLLKCRAGEGGTAAQAGVSPGLGWQLQLLEGLSLAMVKNQHPLPPSFKKTNKIWDFSKGLHSGSVCSLHLGQGVLILHTKSFHHSSEEKQGEKRLTFLLYPDIVLKKIIGAEYIKIPFTPQLLLYLNNNNADHKALSIFNLTCKSLPNHRKKNSIILEWPFQQSFTIPLICQEWLLEHKPQLSSSSGAFPVQDNLPHSQPLRELSNCTGIFVLVP